MHEEYKKKLKEQEAFHRKQIQQQQLYVEDLKQQILKGQVKAERELENDQALINQQILESKYLPLSHFSSIIALFHPFHVFVLVRLCIVVEVVVVVVVTLSGFFVVVAIVFYSTVIIFSYNHLSFENNYQALINFAEHQQHCLISCTGLDWDRLTAPPVAPSLSSPQLLPILLLSSFALIISAVQFSLAAI